MTWHKSWLTRTPRVWRYITHTPHHSWVAPTGQADPHRREGPPACDRQWQGLAGGDTTVTCVVASRRFKSGYFWRHMRGYGEAVRTLRRATRTWSPPDIPRARFERASRGSSRKTAGCAAVARHQRSNSRGGAYSFSRYPYVSLFLNREEVAACSSQNSRSCPKFRRQSELRVGRSLSDFHPKILSHSGLRIRTTFAT